MAGVFAFCCLAVAQNAQTGTAFVATPVGAPIVVFDPRRDACDGHDVPDVPLRAYRDDRGLIRAFALHFENRRLSGPSLLALKPECRVVFRGSGNPDPEKFDDRSWIAATWTPDGKTIHALVHHEFQANEHPGRCAFSQYIQCWWNAILGVRSGDGGQSFVKLPSPVVAATPFGSEHDQGRHRGFFNPSNIVARDGAFYTLIGTTGWNAGQGPSRSGPSRSGPSRLGDQPGSVCLFRSTDLARGDWRGFDGKDYSARFPNPYGGNLPEAQTCQGIAPFPAPVGGIVRHRPSGMYLAVYQAAAGSADGRGGRLSESGFYLSSSKNLLTWRAPTLIFATKSFYDSACGADVVRNYPVLIDDRAETRNFEDIGDEAMLFFSQTRVEGCTPTSDRQLIARKVRISTFIGE